jgi:RTX calcium-binding nonapeptide repeat (4 copies)
VRVRADHGGAERRKGEHVRSRSDRGIASRLSLFAPFFLIVAGASPSIAQDDILSCFGQDATIVGTPGDDRITGTPGPDVIRGLEGDDVIEGLDGNDLICGDEGNNRLVGGRGDDVLSGAGLTSFGRDHLSGGPGDDLLDGGLGHDVLGGGLGNDQLSGGDSDEEDLSPGEDLLSGGPGADVLDGGPGTDTLDGGWGADSLKGGSQGPDVLFGGPGPDILQGSEDADSLWGGPANDELSGGPGNDDLSGGPGDDRLFGDEGDDRLTGGPGNDFLWGGAGRDELVDGGPPSLSDVIDVGRRDLIKEWAEDLTMVQIDDAVAALDPTHRDRLAEVLIDSNATGVERDRFLSLMRTVLSVRDLGFYAEIWSYTRITLVEGGFFGTCGEVLLDPGAFGGLPDAGARDVLMHESFHSFNCVNGGPVGSLDEGSASWVFVVGFRPVLSLGESWAEATYGTKLFYRDINDEPDYPLTAPLNPTARLLEVYGWLSDHDPSKLPWNSQERLVTCYQRYYEHLDRDVDFETEWLPAVAAATEKMVADPGCKPV